MMEGRSKEVTILHIEDDPDLAWIVRKAFEDFGFIGTAFTAATIKEAFDILNERELKNRPLSLIICDIRLPDGSGLDLIREVKTNPYWRVTPVIVLSSDRTPEMVYAAYAVGANSYLPKDPRGGSLVSSLEDFYKCWLEQVQLPLNVARNRVADVLDRGTGLRARTSAFYLDLARGAREDSEIRFWLDRALVSGNLSNLLAFFRDRLSEQDFHDGVIDRLSSSQVQVANVLITVERSFKKTPSPGRELTYKWVLELADAIDEDVFIDALAGLFPKGPVVAEALRTCAAAQFKALATHILERTERPELRDKAASLLDWSRRIEKAGA